jgi:hypothetical protein
MPAKSLKGALEGAARTSWKTVVGPLYLQAGFAGELIHDRDEQNRLVGHVAVLMKAPERALTVGESRDDPRVRSHQPSQRPQGRHEVADFQMLEQIERDDQVEPGPRLDRQFR